MGKEAEPTDDHHHHNTPVTMPEGACPAGEKSCIAGDSKQREVRVDHYFDAPGGNARIYLLHDFVSPGECQVLKERARPRLASAAVTGDTPGEKIGACVRACVWRLLVSCLLPIPLN